MALVVDVPLNTMLADLDETLRSAAEPRARAPRLRGRRHRVRRAGARLVGPALRRRRSTSSSTTCARRRSARTSEWSTRPRQRPHASRCARRWSWSAPTRSPRGRRRSRTSTGCSRRCWRCFYAYPELPAGRAQRAARRRLAERWPIKGRIGQAQGREGGLLDRGRRPVQGVARLRRAALACESGAAFERGPGGPHADRPHALSDGPARAIARDAPLRRHGHDADGEPLADVVGRAARRRPAATSSDADGRFRFDRLPPGRAPARWRARATAREADGAARVPATGRRPGESG